MNNPLSQEKPSSVCTIVDNMLSRRIESNENLNGFNVNGVIAGEMICGDCGDGDCECSS